MDRAGSRVLAALAPTVLLAVDPWGWYPFGPIKWLLVTTLVPVGLGLELFARAPRVPPRLKWALLAFLGWSAWTSAFGGDVVYAFIGTPERHFGVLTWAICVVLLVVGTALDERGARTVVGGVVLAGLGVGAVATAEALGWEPDELDVAGRLSGTLGSPAYLGAAAALLLPVALGVALSRTTAARSGVPPDGTTERDDRRVVATGAAWAASVLLAIACVGSGARAAWLGLLAGTVVVAASSAGSLRAWGRDRPGRVAGAVLAVAVATVLVVLLTPVGSRLSAATDPDAAGGRGRLDEWRVATNVFLESPAVGFGAEGYRNAFHLGVDERYEREHGRRQQPDRAHSVVLDLAVTGGLPLVVAWLFVVGIVGRAAWRTLRSGPLWLRGVAAGLVAHVVGQLLLFPVVELEPIAWLLAGVVVARDLPRPHVEGRMHADPRLAGSVIAISSIGLIVGLVDVRLDHAAERVAQALARGDRSAALRTVDESVGEGDLVVRVHLLAARAEVVGQRGYTAALRRVDDALAISPRDPIARLAKATYLVDRAEATQTVAHRDAARAYVAGELSDDPYAAALWRLEARMAVLDGDQPRAERAAARAEELTPERDR